ncbi:13440_t:CDS:2, partial [Acaulospora colombiana]
MDLYSQIQDLLEFSSNVTLLLREQSDKLICERNLVKNEEEEDLENLSYDIALASKSLRVLELRREISSTRTELLDVKDLVNNYGEENLSNDWIDYAQDAMEHLSLLLKKGIELSSNDFAKAKHVKPECHDECEYEYCERAASPKDFVYYSNRLYRDDSSSESSTNSRPASIVIPSVDADTAAQDLRTRSNLTRRHTMDNEDVSAARFFVGHLGFKKTPSKASTTTFISQEQTSAESLINSGNWPLSVEQNDDDDSLSSPAARQLSQLMVQESTEEFVDAVEKQDDSRSRNSLRKSISNDPNILSRTSVERLNFSSLPATLDSVPEDESLSQWDDYEDSGVERLSSPSFPATSAFQISLHRSKPNLFAEEVNVDNPVRVGTGYGSYIAYTCTIRGQEGANIVTRKRYSDFIRLRSQLIKAHPKYKKLIPCLPPKRVVGKFLPEFIERRRKDLEYFLSYILLHPVLGSNMV